MTPDFYSTVQDEAFETDADEKSVFLSKPFRRGADKEQMPLENRPGKKIKLAYRTREQMDAEENLLETDGQTDSSRPIFMHTVV